MIKFCLLGTPEVLVENCPLTELHSSPILSRLLGFLLTQREQRHLRTDLANVLWPETSFEQSGRRLSNLLWRLRSALGPAGALLVADKRTVQVNRQGNFWWDVDEFTRLAGDLPHQVDNIEQAVCERWEAALALYRGDYLHGIDDAWVIAPRQHWQVRYTQRLTVLLEAWKVQGNVTRALPLAERLAEVAPYNEANHLALLDMLLALNQREQAVSHYQRYLALWQAEANEAPSAQMQQLVQRHQLDPHLASSPVNRPNMATPGQRKTASLAYLRREIEICCKQDELYDLMADRKQQKANLDTLAALVRQINEPPLLIDLSARQGWLATRQGEYTEALALAQTALNLCTSVERTPQKAVIHRLFGVINEEMGNFRATHYHYRQALLLDEALHISSLIAADLNNVAAVAITQGEYLTALHTLQRAERLLLNEPLSAVQVRVAGNRGFAWLALGQLDQATQAFQQAIDLATACGDCDAEWWLLAGQARLSAARQAYAQAVAGATAAYQAVSTSGDACALSLLAELLASLYFASGAPEQALDWAQRTLHYASQRQQWRYVMRGKIRLAQAQALLGRKEEGLRSAAQAMDLYTRQRQTLAEAPELFAVLAQCAEVTEQPIIARQARQTGQTALAQQAAQIRDTHLRAVFLRQFAEFASI